jgi:ArsR family transcriptional regulator, arsenate/arsenite/antimonite-responsive transcriptional repressor
MADAENVARILKVLSVGTRVRIVQLLKGRALCVNALAARLDVTQGAVSQHLRILRDAGLVTAEKRGYFVHYRLNGRALAKCRALLDGLLEVPEEPADASTSTTQTKEEKPCANVTTAAKGRRC